MLNEILIRFEDDGSTVRGVRALDGDGRIIPIDAKALEAFAPSINLGSLARINDLQAEIDTKDATIAANAQTVADAQAVLMTEDEKKAAALQATIDQASAQLSQLTAAKGVSIGAAGAAKAV